MGCSSPEIKSIAGDSVLLPDNPADAIQVGDGRLVSGSSTGEKVADLARSGDSVVDQQVSETHSAKSIEKDNDAKSSSDHRTESRAFRYGDRDPRNLSSDVEMKSPDQCPTGKVICDFYAKGWCIKGSSCRFLHVKDRAKNAPPQAERDLQAVCKKEELHGGLIEHGEGSMLPNPSPKLPNLKSLKRDEMLSISSKDLGSENKRQRGSKNDYDDHGSLALRDGSKFNDGFHLENAYSSGHKFGNSFPPPRSVEEVVGFQHLRPHHYRIQPLTRNSSDPSSNISSSTTTWTGSSLPFSYSSIGSTHLEAISSSLLNSTSRFSGSKLGSLPSIKRKISSTEWEPSIPFRPSFLTCSMLSLPESLYDPICDSIEIPMVRDVSLKPSFYGRGSSIENILYHPTNGESVPDTQGLERNGDTLSVSSHNTLHQKDMQPIGVEVVGTSSSWDYKTTRKQHNSLGPFSFEDTEATSDVRHQHQNQGSRNNVVARKDINRKINQMDARNDVVQSENKESRELKHFRAALIEFVKELLKPKWRDGLLSKVAHNKIVKKAVDKVLVNLPLELVPTSTESIQQYLASSRGKIGKLVDGYTNIYGKVEAPTQC